MSCVSNTRLRHVRIRSHITGHGAAFTHSAVLGLRRVSSGAIDKTARQSLPTRKDDIFYIYLKSGRVSNHQRQYATEHEEWIHPTRKVAIIERCRNGSNPPLCRQAKGHAATDESTVNRTNRECWKRSDGVGYIMALCCAFEHRKTRGGTLLHLKLTTSTEV